MSQFGISLSVDANKNRTTHKNEERIAGTHPCLGGGTVLDRNNESTLDKGKKVENGHTNTVLQ